MSEFVIERAEDATWKSDYILYKVLNFLQLFDMFMFGLIFFLKRRWFPAFLMTLAEDGAFVAIGGCDEWNVFSIEFKNQEYSFRRLRPGVYANKSTGTTINVKKSVKEVPREVFLLLAHMDKKYKRVDWLAWIIALGIVLRSIQLRLQPKKKEEEEEELT